MGEDQPITSSFAEELTATIEDVSISGRVTIKFKYPIENVFKTINMNSSILYLQILNEDIDFEEDLNYTFVEIIDRKLYLDLKFQNYLSISMSYVLLPHLNILGKR